MGSLETASSHDMRITEYMPTLNPCFLIGMLLGLPTLSPCFFIGMLMGLLTYILLMMEFTRFSALQSKLTQRDHDIVQVTFMMLSTTIAFYFAIGGVWGYMIGRTYRAYTLASQTKTRADYGTMASEA
jgi:uncharacterized membrane protein